MPILCLASLLVDPPIPPMIDHLSHLCCMIVCESLHEMIVWHFGFLAGHLSRCVGFKVFHFFLTRDLICLIFLIDNKLETWIQNLLLQTKAKAIELFDQNVWINVIATGHQIPIIKLNKRSNNMLSIDNFSKRWKCLIYNKDLEFELFFPWILLQYRCSFSTCLPIIN